MASGVWGLIPNPGTPGSTGDFVFNADVNIVLPAPGFGNPNKVGTLAYTFLPGEFYLDGVLLTGMDQLPQGFQLLDIDRGAVDPELPNAILIGGAANPAAVTNWSIPELSWGPGSAVWDIEVGTRAILTGITFNVSAETDDVVTGSTFVSGQVSPESGFPNTSVIEGTWDDLGAVVIPASPGVVEGPGPGEVTVTPGANTVIVTINIPGETEIIIPTVPGVPVVVPVPPGGPITVTPYNVPIVSGTPTTLGDIVVEGDLVLDVALQSPIQLMRDPSGIYTLIPGQFYDVLYEHVAGTTTATSQTVPIPRPFGVTNYIPERD